MQRLRRWLLGGMVALLLLLAGFVGYARHRARRALLDLPHLLGADIRSETNGYTYSQTVKGRTLFTIHAAKAIQRQNGKTTLRDVAVTLYGEPGSNRVDSIRGAEFEYDQPNGVIRAMGETTLDLASPSAVASNGKPEVRRILVNAKGVVFAQKLGVAATDEDIRFEYGTTRGSAHGAEYDADTGMLRLRHDVHLLSAENGRMEKVDADAAEIDRNARTAVLHQSTVTDAEDRMRAQTLHVQLRAKDAPEAGSIQQIRGEGGVEIFSGKGTHLTAPSMEAQLSEQNRPETAWLRGGVRLHSEQGDGVAGEARLGFDAAGHARDVHLLRAVRLSSADSAGGPNAGTTRTLDAEQVAATLGSDAGKHMVLQQATATGQARLTVVEAPNGANQPARTTVVRAATLHAIGSTSGGRWEISRVDGDGATSVDERDSTGLERTSTGDRLSATMAAPAAGKRAVIHAGSSGTQANAVQTSALQTLMQQGHVRIVEHRPGDALAAYAASGAAAKPAGESHATADRAEYDAADGTVVLTGSPEVSDTGMQIAAERIAIARDTGEANASGSVKGSYLVPVSGPANGGAGAPVRATADQSREMLHFIADRALLRRRENAATLYGGRGGVRLWNGSAQLEAPVIDVDRGTGRLYAHDVMGSAGGASVRTLLPADAAPVGRTPVGRASGSAASRDASAGAPTSAGAAARKPATGGSSAKAASAGMVRVVSRDLVYTEGSGGTQGTGGKQGSGGDGAPGKAEFHGGVRIDGDGGQIVADTATAFLKAAHGRGSSPFVGDGVERIVAQGRVRLQQPGRTATGDRLIYTSADQQFLLTGTGSVPSVVRDSVQGTLSGASLLFHSGDDSVEVVGADGRPVRTETVAPARKAASRPTLP